MASLNTARQKAKVAKARAELNGLVTALNLLINDTGRIPDAHTTKPTESGACVTPVNGIDNEVDTNTGAAGLSATDGNFPGWAGPYMQVPVDPWGYPYVFDDDYDCSLAPAVGCTGYGNNVRAVHSRGLNGSALNVYDSDNVVRVLCVH